MRNVYSKYFCAVLRWAFVRRRISILAFGFFAFLVIIIFKKNSSIGQPNESSSISSNIDAEIQWSRKLISKREAAMASDSISNVEDSSIGSSTDSTNFVGGDQLLDGKNRVTRIVLKAIQLAVVACGDRIEEPLMMLKSAVIFGRKPLHLHVFTDERLWSKFSDSLQHWQRAITWRSFSYTLYLTNFPTNQADEWRRLFKLCASQRLFIPNILTSIDALLYVDTDVLFLRPPEDLWTYFEHFNDSHIAALSPETEDASTNWYVRFARHPFYKPLGVNSGVMLMNLTRMRQFGWTEYLEPILTKYRYNITWGDQDIINIIFSSNPDKLYIFGCEWNYRPDHCMYSSTCQAAEERGASILHGSRSYFHTAKQPVFKAIYDAFKSYKFGSDLKTNLYDVLRKELASKSNTTCGVLADVFLKQIGTYVDDGNTTGTQGNP